MQLQMRPGHPLWNLPLGWGLLAWVGHRSFDDRVVISELCCVIGSVASLWFAEWGTSSVITSPQNWKALVNLLESQGIHELKAARRVERKSPPTQTKSQLWNISLSMNMTFCLCADESLRKELRIFDCFVFASVVAISTTCGFQRQRCKQAIQSGPFLVCQPVLCKVFYKHPHLICRGLWGQSRRKICSQDID